MIDLSKRFRTSIERVVEIAKSIGGDTVTFRKVVFLSSMAAALSAQVLDVPAGSPNSQDYIVSFRAGTGPSERAQVVLQAGAQARFNYTIVDAAAVRVPNENALAALQRHPRVESIVPDRVMTAIQSPNAKPNKPGGGGDSGAGGEIMPEGVKRVGLPGSSSDGTGIGVAILDTGIDYNHVDLAVAPAKFDAFGGNCFDGNGHGTHVSGIVAAKQGNGTGVVGVAPKATLHCVKVLNDQGSGSDSNIMAGLDWVYQNRVANNLRVVNMSLGRLGTLNDNPSLRAAITKLYQEKIVVVVAAGNDPTKVVNQQVPATYPEVFAVASTTAIDGTEQCSFLSAPIKKDTASYFTTDGFFDGVTRIGVTISAPGEDAEIVSRNCMISSVGILSLKAGGGTTRMSGTSMASPHVAGVVARMMQKGSAEVESIRGLIRSEATLAGTAPFASPTSSSRRSTSISTTGRSRRCAMSLWR
jgi:subtilisin